MTSRYTVFVIYDDKSHYPSTYNVLRKNKVICEENNYISAKLSEKILKIGLIYYFMITNLNLNNCQWNTREP